VTAINNHNGVISNETRLVLVLDKKSGLPIYFRYVAGNIVDVMTLEATLAEVRAYGVDVRHAIVDAGYYSEKNIRAMHESEISFVLRMPPNRKLHKELITCPPCLAGRQAAGGKSMPPI
jgi:transposase